MSRKVGAFETPMVKIVPKEQLPERWDMTKKERDATLLMSALFSDVDNNEAILEERLRKVGMWQKWRTAHRFLFDAWRALRNSMPDDQFASFKQIEANVNMEFVPKMKIGQNVRVLPISDIAELCDIARSDKCAYCVATPAEQRGCRLRKLMTRIAPPGRYRKDGLCPYLYEDDTYHGL